MGVGLDGDVDIVAVIPGIPGPGNADHPPMIDRIQLPELEDVVAFLVSQIGTLITAGTLGQGFLPGLIVTAAIVAFIISLIKKADKKLDAQYALKK